MKVFLFVLIANISLWFLVTVLADDDKPWIINTEHSPIFRRGIPTSPEKLCKEGQGDVEVIASPPTSVYRADFRPPAVIFQKGIKSLGKNDNLLDHMEGISPKNNSIYVSTAATEAAAVKWAEAQMKNKNNKDEEYIYVYKIRANTNYYSMFESLMNAFRQTGEKQYKIQAKVAKKGHQWEACGGVRADEVELATRYERNPANRPQSPYLKNVGVPVQNTKVFVANPTQGNEHVYIPKGLSHRSPLTLK